jgi:hypothetical protein
MFDIFCEILVENGQQDVVNSLYENVRSRFRQIPIVSTDPGGGAVGETLHSMKRRRVETPPGKPATSEQQSSNLGSAESSALSRQNDQVQISETSGAIDQLSPTPIITTENLTREFNTCNCFFLV